MAVQSHSVLKIIGIVDTGGTITNATDIATLNGIIEKARAGKSTPYFFNKRSVVSDKVYMMMSVVQQIVVNDEDGSYICCMYTESGSADIQISMQEFVKEGNTWTVSTTYHTINDSQ